MDWFKKVVFENYANFKGRARRKEYWVFMLIFVVITFVLSIPAAFMGALGNLLIIVWYLALLIPMIAVTVRRFHDSRKSGWWYLASFAPIVPATATTLFVDYGADGAGLMESLFWVLVAASLIVAFLPIVFLFLNSEPSTNKWGPNPKDELVNQEARLRYKP